MIVAMPGCPNAALPERRLIADGPQAAGRRMHGPPTLLVSGQDPFAAPARTPRKVALTELDTQMGAAGLEGHGVARRHDDAIGSFGGNSEAPVGVLCALR
jgi:hypothetical protein